MIYSAFRLIGQRLSQPKTGRLTDRSADEESKLKNQEEPEENEDDDDDGVAEVMALRPIIRFFYLINFESVRDLAFCGPISGMAV